MLQINVSQLLQEPIGATREYEIDDVVEIAGGDSQVRGRAALIRINRGILVQGALKADVGLTCSRCLSSFRSPLTLNLEEQYYPTRDVSTGAPLVVPEESCATTIDEHHILDLTETIQQYATLALPMKPLCRENCAGLCPGRGHNLNQGDCGCSPQESDSRWAALQKLTVARSKDT